MEVFDAVRTMLAVRDYREQRVPGEILHRVLEAGRLTASAANKQPWHFVVVQEPETLQQLGEAMPRNAPYVAGAPLAIVVVVERHLSLKAETAAASDTDTLALPVGVLTAGPPPAHAADALARIPEARLRSHQGV